MIVLDTNVVVHLVTKDDIEQVRQAVALLGRRGPFWIGREVILETGWTLKAAYGYSREEVARALHLVVTLDNVQVEGGDRMRKALRLHAAGLDLGDALILAFAPDGATVASFDERFVKRARRSTRPETRVRLVGDLDAGEE